MCTCLPVYVLVNHIHNRLHIINGRVLQDAMAEVEDVTKLAIGATQNIVDAFFDLRQESEEDCWIEIPLNGDIVSEQ